MVRRVFVATGNKGKFLEFQELLGDFFHEETCFLMREARGIVETGATFEANAELKAIALVKELLKEDLKEFIVIADDSGLSVDALGGRPGVYSARYGGEEASFATKVKLLLEELKEIKDLEKRRADFVCVLSFFRISQGIIVENFQSRGLCEGYIAFAPQGEKGFGYDPIFWLPQYKAHMAELEPQEKNKISHRRNALAKLGELLKNKTREV